MSVDPITSAKREVFLLDWIVAPEGRLAVLSVQSSRLLIVGSTRPSLWGFLFINLNKMYEY
jgi:hypothetical protein